MAGGIHALGVISHYFYAVMVTHLFHEYCSVTFPKPDLTRVIITPDQCSIATVLTITIDPRFCLTYASSCRLRSLKIGKNVSIGDDSFEKKWEVLVNPLLFSGNQVPFLSKLKWLFLSR